ncbi:vesicle-associated membrane protein 2 [Galendromus occidentalis]|uniref:Vesicle-associated membrane protein 2 n=1 Tax=Galendromus occidentalis TaxID=34638 RepID=A0AAJ6QTP5_9ACAR|nr:vesicle-associated membrane protein 2 [Galendromus occidentalis]
MERREGPETEKLLNGRFSDEDEDILDVAHEKKLKKVQFEVDQVQEIMRDNVEKITERSERIIELQSKSDALNESADSFLQASKRMKQRLWWREHRLFLAAGLLVIGVLVFLVLTIKVSLYYSYNYGGKEIYFV